MIYAALEEIENSLKGMLKPEFEEVQSGVAEIREIFRSSKIGNIAGVIVRSGTITRNAKARVIRDGVVVGDNLAIESLRRFKDDVTEVRRTSRLVSAWASSTTSRSATRSRRSR